MEPTPDTEPSWAIIEPVAAEQGNAKPLEKFDVRPLLPPATLAPAQDSQYDGDDDEA